MAPETRQAIGFFSAGFCVVVLNRHRPFTHASAVCSPRSRLSESPALTVSVSIFPYSILGKSAFILRTDANEQARGHHPRTIVEIADDVRLRDTPHLNDGEIVEIVVPL